MNLSNRQVEHPYLDTLAIIFVAVVIVGSIFGFTRFQEVEKAKTAFAQKQKNMAATIAEFDKVMAAREEFLAISARAGATLAGIQAKATASVEQKAAWDKEASSMQASYDSEVAAIKAHNDAENAKYKSDPRYTTRDYWTFPTNPGQPAALTLDFAPETTALKASAAEVETFVSKLKNAEADYKMSDTKTMFKDLLKSAESLESGLGRNVEIMDGLVSTGKQGQVVNEAKADLIKYNTEDEWLVAFRALAVEFIKSNNLDLIDYDLPGGTDANPADKSQI